MKLIDRAEKIGLTWLGTTTRTRFILQQHKHNRTTVSVQVMKNQLQKHGYFYTTLICEKV